MAATLASPLDGLQGIAETHLGKLAEKARAALANLSPEEKYNLGRGIVPPQMVSQAEEEGVRTRDFCLAMFIMDARLH